MPIEFDPRLRLFRVTLEGRVDADEVLGTLRALIAHPDFYPGAPAIWIAHAADMSALTRDALLRFREFQIASAAKRGKARLAFVSSNDLAFGIGRMFEQTADLANMEIRVFRDTELAERWIVGSPDP